MEIDERLYDHINKHAVSDNLKVSHSLTSGGTFVVYIVHPIMCFPQPEKGAGCQFQTGQFLTRQDV